jgi:hypothetical protein
MGVAKAVAIHVCLAAAKRNLSLWRAQAFPRAAISGDMKMPAKSAAQQKAAGAALSAKRGDTPKSKLKGAARGMEESMSQKELEKMAHTKRKGKPEHVSK